MFHSPAYIENVSVALAEVLRDIGVNEEIVTKRRRTLLLGESMRTIKNNFSGEKTTINMFGSQSEGTTTIGLLSDYDILTCSNTGNVIQDWRNWKPRMNNYMMIQDETVSPGYCLLQRLGCYNHVPCNCQPPKYHLRDIKGRTLLMNSYILSLSGGIFTRHGPSLACTSIDLVYALPCFEWPLQAREWLNRQGIGRWPTDEMKRYCSTTTCFLVAVGSKGGPYEEFEWRISTALAERCLMFNLNITQIQCYVLMKMILRTFIAQHAPDIISSYMCKTVLFHCVANTHSNVWRENKLLDCLSLCLSILYSCIFHENCPHFIIPKNNLMANRITPESKFYILELLQTVLLSNGEALLMIDCDDLGQNLEMKLMGMYRENAISLTNQKVIATCLHLFTALFTVAGTVNDVLLSVTNSSFEQVLRTLFWYIVDLVSMFYASRGVDRVACSLIVPWICTALGSVMASKSIQLYNDISPEALAWISLGLNTDVASSKLKLASIFYCSGDTQRTEILLRKIEESYDVNQVTATCCCRLNASCKRRNAPKVGYAIPELSVHLTAENAIRYIFAFSVQFLPVEVNCIPKELKYEMLRSTLEDQVPREDDYLTVVGSLPYLCFLQYKTYGYLGKQEEKQKALSKFIWVIDRDINLQHRDTALNLLGPCMEQENRTIAAFRCYSLSLSVRRRNNVAKIHICRLLNGIINRIN